MTVNIKRCILTMTVVRFFVCCRIGRTDRWQSWRMRMCNEIDISTILESSVEQIESSLVFCGGVGMKGQRELKCISPGARS